MRWIFVVGAVAACTTSSSVLCGSGTLCPADTLCAQVTQADTTVVDLCVSQAQMEACSGKSDGDACSDGTCHGGACLPNECGNNLVDVGEQCDDGNQIDDATCSGNCMSTEVCGNGVIDLNRGEQCDNGPDHAGRDGCSSACVVEHPAWHALQLDRPLGSRTDATFVYDTARRRLVLFGGTAPATYFNDTFELDGLRWHHIDLVRSPPERRAQMSAYDTASHRTIIFSGSNQAADTWAYDGTWTQLTPTVVNTDTAHVLGPLMDGAMAAAPGGGVVMFGGTDAVDVPPGFSPTSTNQTWVFRDNTWTHVMTAHSPGVRYYTSMAYDPVRNVDVLYGGEEQNSADGSIYDDLWEFDGTDWTQRTFTTGPGGRISPQLAFDPVNQKIMLVGGSDINATQLKDTWEWNGTAWTKLAADAITIQYGRIAGDPIHQRVVLYDGVGNFRTWNGSAWDSGTALGSGPASPTRASAAGYADPIHQMYVVFGGTTAPTEPAGGTAALGDTIIFDRNGYNLQAAAPAPAARWGATMVYDAKRERGVLFGGCSKTDASTGCVAGATAFADTWKFDGATRAWSQIASSGPVSREHAMMAYDIERDRIVLFGGHDVAGFFGLDDTWEFDGSTWARITTTTQPSKRWDAAFGYDPIRKQTILFGGSLLNRVYDETWMWNGTTWTHLAPAHTPGIRLGAKLVWDPARKRLVMATSGSPVSVQSGEPFTSTDDAWEWDGTDWSLQVTAGGTPSITNGRVDYVAFPSVDGSGVVISGGAAMSAGVYNLTAAPNEDVWQLHWNAETHYETCTDVDGDGDGLVGCADPDCAFMCTPRCTPGTSCAALPTCGDGACDANTEQCDTCPVDCGACKITCGNGACEAGESVATCPGDCQ